MATIDSVGIIKVLLARDGHYDDDPQALAIYTFINLWGGRSYSVSYNERAEQRFLSSESVSEAKLLWNRASGLTAIGQQLASRGTL